MGEFMVAFLHVFVASRTAMNSYFFIHRWHALQLVRRSTFISPRTGFNSVCIREENGTPCQQQNCVRWCHHLSHVLPVGVLIRPDVFNGYGYFYVRLYCTCLGFQANTVEEYVLLSALLHIFVGLKRTWDQKLSSGLKLQFLVSNWSRTFGRSPEQRVFPYLWVYLSIVFRGIGLPGRAVLRMAFVILWVHVFVEFMAIDLLKFAKAPGPSGDRGDMPLMATWG